MPGRLPLFPHLRRATRALVLAALLALPLPAPGLAQAAPPAALIADRVEVLANRKLRASGNVEVLHEGRRLRATVVEYDREADRLVIEGPIVLTEAGDGAGAILIADAADLAGDLREGVLTSARLVLDRQLQLAANEILRTGGRYTALNRAVASSCQVCDRRQVPLWEIRARRVVHDQLERQIHFESAQMRLGGVPVFWVPHLRMPDPTLTRATGFLMPRLVSTSTLGTGLHVPYFIRLGDHRDLTLTPFLATKDVTSLAFRYRQAVRNGRFEVAGAVSNDSILAGRRGFLTAEGAFELGRGFRLTFSGETVSDRGYLLDYGISSRDRLDSRVELARVRRDELIAARVIHFHSIRAGEVNSSLASLVGDVTWRRRFDVPHLGGVAGLELTSHGHYRSSRLDGDDGRDVVRSSLRLDWRRDWRLAGGVLAAVQAEVAGDLHRVAQDARWPRRVSTLTPSGLAELRWPLARVTGAGATEVLEPVLQLAWARPQAATALGRVPNEDSVLVEFDEGNLFAASRFAGIDRREGGARLNIGLGWTRFAASGTMVSAQAGRVLRARDLGQFTTASGLSGRRSDWLLGLHVARPDGLALQGRALLDDGFGLTRGEIRLRKDRTAYGIAAGYVWALADPAENRPVDTSEFVFDGRVAMTRGWTAIAAGRYDFARDKATLAALGLEFANECLRVDVSLSRRFTSSTNVVPTTNFGFSVDFIGFGSGRAGSRGAGPAGTSAACRS